jgi:ribose 5-phosphate isomerase B
MSGPEVQRSGPPEELVRQLVERAMDRLAGPGTASSTVMPAAAAVAPEAAGTTRTVAIGADHGGFQLKQAVVKALTEKGYGVTDCGTTSTDAVDYPDFAHAVARLVATGRCAAGIVIDGAGIGSCMAANKVPGVRAAACWDISSARNSREHNHANVLTLGARMIGRAWRSRSWTRSSPRRGAPSGTASGWKVTAIEQHYLRSRPGTTP